MTGLVLGPHSVESDTQPAALAPLSAREKLEIRRDRAAEQRRLARRRKRRAMRGTLLTLLALAGVAAFAISETARNKAAPWAAVDFAPP